MKHFGWRPAVLAGTIILPLAAAYRWNTLPAFILLGLWIALVYWLGLKMVHGELAEQHRLERLAARIKDEEAQTASLSMATPAESSADLEQLYETAIEAFSHHRHDWMNDLQLLYGYVQLGNRERLVENIERIKEQMNADSRVSRLGIPQLVFYLQTFTAVNRNIKLELEIEDGMTLAARLTPEQSEALTRVMQQTISAYEQYGGSSWGECPTLFIMIRSSDDGMEVIFEPEGEYPDAETLWLEVNRYVQSTDIRASRLEEDPSSITLHIE
ncbi:Spo0B domain-containing protein [Paenibacillus hunanensis]|uniref:Spo0B domain-containing protein n=1 Tax=Paenibacillus hunanensis TaxID=539262 RepID=UPI002A6A6645|nr:Spo0B domain-containing protein [Paenibacillus hunanensis]WPP42509.1 Spo0B domain-containing protein [Paenibacillus hunanensis]